MAKIFIAGPAYPLRGGLATFDERLARQLINEGHEVVIYTFFLQYPSILFPGKTQYSTSPAPADLNIKVVINSISPFNWWRVGRMIKSEKADYVIFRYWMPFMAPCLGTIARIARRNNITKTIAIVDNAIPHERRPGDTILTKYFIGGIDRFVTMSEKVKEDLHLFTKMPVRQTVHPLYDNFGTKPPKSESRAKLKLPQDAYVYLFFGFIRQYKGLDLLIDAFNTVAEANPKAYLLIAGEYYAGEDDIKGLIQAHAFKDRIAEHTHFISDEEVRDYFSAADAVVQPYRNATQSGVTPLAYHFEVPMIVTNVGALPDMITTEIGIVCEPEPSAIAKAMENIVELDITKFDLAIKAEKSKYNWETLTEVLLGE